jgi:hypothetical protein
VLRWQRSPDADVVSYRVLVGLASGQYTQRVDVKSLALDAQGVASTTLAGLDGAQRYVALVAVDASGQESVPSNERIIPAAPAPTPTPTPAPAPEPAPAPAPAPGPVVRSALVRWQPSPDTDVNLYRILVGSETGVYTQRVDVQSFARDAQGFASTTLSGLDGARRFIALVAVDAAGQESVRSNELVIPAVP